MANFVKVVLPALAIMVVGAAGSAVVYGKYFAPPSGTVVSMIQPASGMAATDTAIGGAPISGNTAMDVAGTTDTVQGTTDTGVGNTTATSGTPPSADDIAAPTTTSPTAASVTPGNAAIGTTSTGQAAAATDKSLDTTAPADTH